jgi:hypothetical protein
MEEIESRFPSVAFEYSKRYGDTNGRTTITARSQSMSAKKSRAKVILAYIVSSICLTS